jgi:hypothetical protein
MYTVDTSSGTATLISPIGNNTIQLGSFAIAVPSGPCGQPADQPWLSLNPSSGTTAPAADTPVTVGIDATGHVDGDVLAGTVCVRSNDPDEHTVPVPVSYTVGGTGPGNIVDSGQLDRSINADFTGLYINWLTGDTCDADTDIGGSSSCNAFGVYNFNPWNNSGLTFAYADVGNCVSSGTSCSVLASGAVIGPASTFSGGNSTNFRASSGYIGFSFTCPAGTCYGYAQLTTTATSGFPATLNRYWYDNSGAAISIP